MADLSFSDPDRAAVYRAIRSRRDVRSYLPDPVAPDLLRRLLEAAHQAPSVGFMQPWNFLLVDDPALKASVHAHVVATSAAAGQTYTGRQAATYQGLKLQGILEAPVNLVVTCDPERGGNVLGRHTMPETAAYSAVLAVQNLWLAARAEGLGVGWVSILEPGVVRGLLGIPPRVQIIAWLTLGWPVELPDEPLLARVGWRQRLALEDLVFRDRWDAPAALSPAPPPSPAVADVAARQARLTRPPGSLGRLEALVLQIADVQGGAPRSTHKALVLCAGDHGVVAEGVSAYQARVTARMVLQFAAGGAAINAFARQHGIALTIADLGTDHDFAGATGVLHHKVRRGTRNFTVEPAMTPDELSQAEAAGAALLPRCDVLGLGEMGIGNSTSAAAIAAALLGLDPEVAVGRGTGIGDQTWARKVAAVRRGLALHAGQDPLRCLGGYEIAAMVGLITAAVGAGVPVVLDGFIAGVAALIAVSRRPELARGLIAGHRSAEAGHGPVLAALGLRPLLDLELRLGEGSGAALALGLVESAVRVYREMATFEEAGLLEPLDPRGRR